MAATPPAAACGSGRDDRSYAALAARKRRNSGRARSIEERGGRSIAHRAEPRNDPFTGLARGLGQSVARSMVHVPGVTSAVGPMALIEPDVLPGELAEHWESLRPLAAPVAAVVDSLRKSLPRLSDRPDSRSSSVVDLHRSLI